MNKKPKLLCQNPEDPEKCLYRELEIEPTKDDVEQYIGPFEVANLLSGDIICIPIREQKLQKGLLNKIACSLLQQKVWGDCILFDKKDARFFTEPKRKKR
jgi:hypothetical protein